MWVPQTPYGEIAVDLHCRSLWRLAHKKADCPKGFAVEGGLQVFGSGAGDWGIAIFMLIL